MGEKPLLQLLAANQLRRDQHAIPATRIRGPLKKLPCALPVRMSDRDIAHHAVKLVASSTTWMTRGTSRGAPDNRAPLAET
jgi:hypothetical protein